VSPGPGPVGECPAEHGVQCVYNGSRGPRRDISPGGGSSRVPKLRVRQSPHAKRLIGPDGPQKIESPETRRPWRSTYPGRR